MKLTNDQIDLLYGARFDESLERLRSIYLEAERDRQRLKETICTWNQADELGKLRTAMDRLRMHSLLIMNETELQRLEEFQNRHWSVCKNSGHWLYDIEGTGIGPIIKVKCPVCGEEEDITDAESW